ncbi:MAG TPA: nickel-responsive transcriptional regulator NikR [Nitrososphaerales archaeon]
MTNKTSRISISTPKDLLTKFDDTITQMGYDRSKAIQQAMNNILAEQKWTQSPKTTVAGAVILVYNHETTGLDEKLVDVQHKHAKIINSTLHLHLSAEDCMQIVAVKGPSDEIQKLTEELSANRGVKQLKYSIIAT